MAALRAEYHGISRRADILVSVRLREIQLLKIEKSKKTGKKVVKKYPEHGVFSDYFFVLRADAKAVKALEILRFWFFRCAESHGNSRSKII